MFHEVRFPGNISFGALGGPVRRTEIVTLQNGHEERNTPWAHARRRYDAGLGLRSLDDLEALIGFFEARRGQLYGFRWKDWADYKSCPPSAQISALDQQIGAGDGQRVSFGLQKLYRSGAEGYLRPISKPVSGQVLVALAQDIQQEGIDFTVDVSSAALLFAEPPPVGALITAGFEFDVPVRFDTDSIQVSVASFQAGEMPSVPLLEIRI